MSKEYEIYWLKKDTVLNGKYKILDVISEGGFGIVYLGHDLTLDMDVAIKEFFPRRFAMRSSDSEEIHPYKGDSEKSFRDGMEKFLEEARVLAKFHDINNVVMVRDFFFENNTAYLVNEHIDARTIRHCVKENGPFSPTEVLTMMEPILMSLERIHETGLLHRDISPDNLILRENGEAVLIDFGAARLANVQEDLTITVFFKRGYSAEEQYARNGKQGTFTDVYAICATMYYMLTGIQPEESVQRHIQDKVVPLSKMKEVEMPGYQKNAIMKGMSVLAENRFQTVGELREALYGKENRRLSLRSCLACGGVIFFILISLQLIWNRTDTNSHGKYPDMTAAPSVTKESVLTPKAVQGEETDTTQVTAASATPVPVYEIPDVTGMKTETARKKIRLLAEPGIKIKIKKVYSKKIKKNHVVSQSIKAGKYKGEKHKRIVLTVSKGKKVVKATEEPIATAVPTAPPAEKENGKKLENDFAGELPW